MPSKKHLPLTLALALSSSPLIASNNPGSHQHGHADLELAFSGNQVEVMLVSPAGNMLGFEHQPRTEKQQRAWDDVSRWLEQTPLIDTPDGNCMVQKANVLHNAAEDHSQKHHKHHDHTHARRHTDIIATQILICPELNRATSLTTPVNQRFPAIDHLDIAWVGLDGQGATRLEQGGHSFSLRH